MTEINGNLQRIYRWVAVGASTALLSVFLVIIGWIWSSFTIMQEHISLLQSQMATHEAESKGAVSRTDFEILQNLVYDVRGKVSEVDAKVIINTRRVDQLEEDHYGKLTPN